MKMYERAITVLVLTFPCLVEAHNGATPTRLRIPAQSIKAKAKAEEKPSDFIYLGLEKNAALRPLKKIRVEASYGEDSEEESMSMSMKDSQDESMSMSMKDSEDESMSMSGEDSEDESMSMSSMPVTMPPTSQPSMMPSKTPSTTPTTSPSMTPTTSPSDTPSLSPTLRICRWYEHTCDDGSCVGIVSKVGCPCDNGEQRCGASTYYGGYCAPVCCASYERICYDHHFAPAGCASIWGGVCPSDPNTKKDLLKAVA